MLATRPCQPLSKFICGNEIWFFLKKRWILKGTQVNCLIKLVNLGGWSWLVDDSYWFWGLYIKGQGHNDIEDQSNQ